MARMRWSIPTQSDFQMSLMSQQLTAVFRQVMELQPSVLILDYLDFLVPSQGDGKFAGGIIGQQQATPTAVDQMRLLADHLGSLMEYCASKVTIFVITCRSTPLLLAEIKDSLTCNTAVKIASLSPMERAK